MVSRSSPPQTPLAPSAMADHRHDETGDGRSPRAVWHVTIIGFFALSFLVLAFQELRFDEAVAHGMVIPDVVNIAATLQRLWNQSEILGPNNQFIGITAVYGWTWVLHPALCFLANIALVAAAIPLFKRVVVKRLKAPDWTILGLLANPYLVLAMPGPNKEIPLLLLSLLFADALIRKDMKYGRAVAAGVGAYFFHDGYGLFLVFFALLAALFWRREQYLNAIILLTAVVVSASAGILYSFIPALGRNVAIYESIGGKQALGRVIAQLGWDPLFFPGSVGLFGIRLMYNLCSNAVFPVLTAANGALYWIGLAYWVFGIMVLASLPACTVMAWGRWKGTHEQRVCAALITGVWFAISVSLFVQPRYLMPILPLAVGLLGATPRVPKRIFLGGALLLPAVVITFYQLNNRAPVALPEPLSRPSYLLSI